MGLYFYSGGSQVTDRRPWASDEIDELTATSGEPNERNEQVPSEPEIGRHPPLAEGPSVAEYLAMSVESLRGEFWGVPVTGEYIPVFRRLLGDSHAGLRAQSAWALSKLGQLAEPCFTELQQLLRDPEADVRQSAAYAVWGITRHIDILINEALLSLRQAKSDKEKHDACGFAAQVPEATQAMPKLLELARIEDGYVSTDALRALVCMAPTSPEVHEVMANELQSYRGGWHKIFDGIASVYRNFRVPVPSSLEELIKRAVHNKDLQSELLNTLSFETLLKDSPRADGKQNDYLTDLSRTASFLQQPPCRETGNIVFSLRFPDRLPADLLQPLIRAAELECEHSGECQWPQLIPAELANCEGDRTASIPALLRFCNTHPSPGARQWARFAIEKICPVFLTPHTWRLNPDDFQPPPVSLPSLSQVLPESQSDDVPSPDSIESEIDAVQGPIVEQLNAWLRSLEGTTFSCEQAEQRIDQIRSLVAKAGCDLFFQEQRVSLGVDTLRRKTAAIRIVTLGQRPKRDLHNASTFPRLEARPVSCQ